MKSPWNPPWAPPRSMHHEIAPRPSSSPPLASIAKKLNRPSAAVEGRRADVNRTCWGATFGQQAKVWGLKAQNPKPGLSYAGRVRRLVKPSSEDHRNLKRSQAKPASEAPKTLKKTFGRIRWRASRMKTRWQGLDGEGPQTKEHVRMRSGCLDWWRPSPKV